MSSALSRHDRGTTIALQALPRASRTEVVDETAGWLRVRVAAPPVDGAANQAIVAWLSKQLKIPKQRIEILSGERGRKKVVLIEDMAPDDVQRGLGLAGSPRTHR